MLEKTFSLLFYLKKPKNYLKRYYAYLLAHYCGWYSKEISTGRQCDPDRWNANTGRCNGTREDAKSLNAFLDILQTKVYEVERKLLEKNEIITAERLKNTLKGN
jgi:hypothetical protein